MTTQTTFGTARRVASPPTGRTGGALAVVLIGAAVLLMTMVCVAGRSAAVPAVGPGPLPLHVSAGLSDSAVTVLCWVAILIGGLGTWTGLVALRRGWRPRARTLLIWGAVAVAMLTAVSVAGSTDALDYAIYGRIAALGHDPYVLTPRWLIHRHDPVGRYAPLSWRHTPSLYGPLAVGLFGLASTIGGTSMAATVFVLKVFAGAAFLATGVGLDRLVRADQAARIRVHLLWTLNPVMLWGMVVGAHVDAIAAALIVAAILVLRRGGATSRGVVGGTLMRGVLTGVAAGGLLGAATAIKLPYVLAGVGLIWMVRRSAVTVVCGAVAVLVIAGGGYLVAGSAAIRALTKNAGNRSDIDPWSFVNRHLHFLRPLTTSAGPLAILAFVALTALAWWSLSGRSGLPDQSGRFGLSGLRGRFGWSGVSAGADPLGVLVAFAIVLGWLATSPYQHPWYDAMLFPLLALLPRTRLDGLLVARGAVAWLGYIPGDPARLSPVWFNHLVKGTLMPRVVPFLLDLILLGIFLVCLRLRFSPRMRSRAGR